MFNIDTTSTNPNAFAVTEIISIGEDCATIRINDQTDAFYVQDHDGMIVLMRADDDEIVGHGYTLEEAFADFETNEMDFGNLDDDNDSYLD